MKLIFNDATEIIVQQVESHGDYLRILTVGIFIGNNEAQVVSGGYIVACVT